MFLLCFGNPNFMSSLQNTKILLIKFFTKFLFQMQKQQKNRKKNTIDKVSHKNFKQNQANCHIFCGQQKQEQSSRMDRALWWNTLMRARKFRILTKFWVLCQCCWPEILQWIWLLVLFRRNTFSYHLHEAFETFLLTMAKTQKNNINIFDQNFFHKKKCWNLCLYSHHICHVFINIYKYVSCHFVSALK